MYVHYFFLNFAVKLLWSALLWAILWALKVACLIIRNTLYFALDAVRFSFVWLYFRILAVVDHVQSVWLDALDAAIENVHWH